MSNQAASPLETLKDLVSTIARLQGVIREMKDSGVPDSIELRADFQEPLNNVLLSIQSSPIGEQDACASERERKAKIIINDTLVRIDAVHGSTIASGLGSAAMFDQVWSNESISALEKCVSWLRVETQNAQHDKITGSRVLWTGPMQNQSDSKLAAEPEIDNSLVAGEISADLLASVKTTLDNVDKAELIQNFILERLKFTNIKAREEEVSKAHRKTFKWAFAARDSSTPTSSKRDNDFVAWLSNEDQSPIYWINGKAGSGKSTLLRFIVEHEQTMKCLKQWTGNAPLILLRYFFWTSGSVLQRSHAGLLRSLLFQLLDQRRDLIAWTFPELWMMCQDTKSRVGMSSSWELAQLLRGFHRAFRLASRDTKLCIFIDGLDEFEGDEAVIVSLVKDIVYISSNIRICVSSRPWIAFEKAFQKVPQMLLQDLTLADMDGFVTAKMSENKRTQHLMEVEAPNFERFKAEILQRAQGVFLWTILALRFLLRAVDDNVAMDELRTRISKLPSDLEELFEYLLFDDRATASLQQQSHALQIVRARDIVCNFTGDESVRAITLYQMSLAHEGQTGDIQSNIAEAGVESVWTKCNNFISVLEHDCANLLVLGTLDKVYEQPQATLYEETAVRNLHLEANRTVHYLHRTIRDFFEYSGIWSRILANGNPDYDSHQALLLSHILRLRSPLSPPQQHRHLDDWWHDDVVPAMTHARYATSSTKETRAYLLDTLNATLDAYWKKKKISDDQDTWARNAFSSFEIRMKHKTPFYHPFLSLAAKFGLTDYLTLKMTNKNCAYKAGIPLLSHAFEFLVDRRKTVYPLSSEEVIAALLRSGEDPNQPYYDMGNKPQTPWLMALRYVREGVRRGWVISYDIRVGGMQRWVRIMGLMLEHGADPRAVIAEDKWDPEITALGIIKAAVGRCYSSDAYRLQKTLLEKMTREDDISLTLRTNSNSFASTT